MIKRAILVAIATFATLLALEGCQYGALQNESQSCDRLADYSDRKACLDKIKAQEREWEKRKN